jgi:hypothetical protein
MANDKHNLTPNTNDHLQLPDHHNHPKNKDTCPQTMMPANKQ